MPLYKRGDAEETSNYRGISLLCSAYKLYAEILSKLVQETDEKKVKPETQAGFRKGSSTMDYIYIYVLNHIVLREMNSKGNKEVYALFMDMKAAFDKVNRSKLWEIGEEGFM